ncbi:MAG: hypothetical protein ABFC24_11390 [Methanoregulaceae archaeon]
MSSGEPESETCRYERESNAIQKFFRRPFFQSLTIGLPFCVYKILFGITAVRLASPGDLLPGIFGMLVLVWAMTDLLMNAGRIALDIYGKEAPFDYCSIAQVGRIVRRPMIFLAIDTLLTFAIICFMLWSGWIGTLTPSESGLWAFATTLNLISLSLVSLYNEIRRV